MKIINLQQIKELLPSLDVITSSEVGFIAYSQGKTVTPPIGELHFNKPPGDVHIKYGYILGDNYYVVKIASGFYENPLFGLPSSNGLMLLFDQKTGALLAILLDEGYLTDLRTAAAGAIAAKYLAPSIVHRIGIIGTGTQARLQLKYLKNAIQCNEVIVWGRNKSKLSTFQAEMQSEGFNVQTTQVLEELTSTCNLIVTTTPASSPILFAEQIKKGTHITAVGADTSLKQELHENIFTIADVIVADSISQALERGDSSYAIKKAVIYPNQILELGNIITGTAKGRIDDEQITVVDLTGLAVQDLQIAKIVYEGQLLFLQIDHL